LRARDAGLLVVGAGDNVVRLLPPLIIGEADVAEAVPGSTARQRDRGDAEAPGCGISASVPIF
jgi:hypothetical protein